MMRIGFALAVALALGTGCLDAGPGYLTGKTPPYVRNTSPDMGNLVRRNGVLEGNGNDIVGLTPQLVVTFSKAMDSTASVLSAGLTVCCAPGTTNPVAIAQPVQQPGQTPETPDSGDVPYTVISSVPATSPLASNSSYTLILTTALHDVEGRPLREEVRIPFSTMP